MSHSPAAPALPPDSAHVSFLRPVTPDSMGALLVACQTLMSEGVRHVHLALGSGGGSIIAGLAAFNQLRALPLRFTTYNVSSVDSVAILLFLLGEERLTDSWTSFLFHGVSWNFPTNGDTASSQVADAFACIARYEATLSGITASCTGLSLDRVRSLRAASTIVGAEEAVGLGIATRMGPFSIPPTGRWWQV